MNRCYEKNHGLLLLLLAVFGGGCNRRHDTQSALDAESLESTVATIGISATVLSTTDLVNGQKSTQKSSAWQVTAVYSDGKRWADATHKVKDRTNNTSEDEVFYVPPEGTSAEISIVLIVTQTEKVDVVDPNDSASSEAEPRTQTRTSNLAFAATMTTGSIPNQLTWAPVIYLTEKSLSNECGDVGDVRLHSIDQGQFVEACDSTTSCIAALSNIYPLQNPELQDVGIYAGKEDLQECLYAYPEVTQ